ncbi:MAG: serine/threonine-protein kinase [Byssovorax sp.]
MRKIPSDFTDDPSLDAGDPTVMTGQPAGMKRELQALGIGSTVDERYIVEAELGHGGMGLVYLARDAWLGRRVALKVVAPRHTLDATITQSFLREATALAALRSPHIVQVYAFGAHAESYYFAMEYVCGQSLRRILQEHEKHGAVIPLHRSLTILKQLAEGLVAVHAAGLIHRDVKPSNVLVEDGTGRPVLIDFGLAVKETSASRLKLAGTPRYMAPERFAVRGAITPRADLYALGCIAFELLTGHPAFFPRKITDLPALAEHAPVPSQRRPELSPFDEVIARALAPSPADRWESCEAFAAALLDAGRRVSGPWPDRQPSSRPGDTRLRVLVVDDDAVIRKLASAVVQYAFSLEVVVTTAASGMEAIERCLRDLPDILILDQEMPGLDGVDTLSRIRSMRGGNTVRVLVLSGHVADLVRWRFGSLGVGEFETKPFDPAQLAERLKSMLGPASQPT